MTQLFYESFQCFPPTFHHQPSLSLIVFRLHRNSRSMERMNRDYAMSDEFPRTLVMNRAYTLSRALQLRQQEIANRRIVMNHINIWGCLFSCAKYPVGFLSIPVNRMSTYASIDNPRYRSGESLRPYNQLHFIHACILGHRSARVVIFFQWLSRSNSQCIYPFNTQSFNNIPFSPPPGLLFVDIHRSPV